MSQVRKYLKAFQMMKMIMMSEECVHLEYLLKGVPSGPIRNFSKFQAMSVLLTGDQMMNFGFPRLAPWQSELGEI
jgi:hypothetical protein